MATTHPHPLTLHRHQRAFTTPLRLIAVCLLLFASRQWRCLTDAFSLAPPTAAASASLTYSIKNERQLLPWQTRGSVDPNAEASCRYYQQRSSASSSLYLYPVGHEHEAITSSFLPLSTLASSSPHHVLLSSIDDAALKTLAEGLGYLIGAASILLYTPIAVRILRTKSADGLTVSTWWLKLTSYTCTDVSWYTLCCSICIVHMRCCVCSWCVLDWKLWIIIAHDFASCHYLHMSGISISHKTTNIYIMHLAYAGLQYQKWVSNISL